MKRILLFEPSRERRKALTRDLRARYGWRTKFSYFETSDVFTKRIPDKALVAFFTFENMYDLEAARKFSTIRRLTPIIAVCDKGFENEDSKGYCLETYGFGTCGYFLLRPYDGDELDKALRLCAEWVEQNKKYRWKGI